MDSASVFVKTQKGRDEVRTRSHQLSARERTTLIMIDGKRRAADLRALSLTPDEVEKHLHALLESGLIELQIASDDASETSDSNQASQIARPASDMPPPVTESAVTPSIFMQTQPCPELEKTRRFILEVAEEALGDKAAEFTNTLVELHDRQALLNFAQHLHDVLHRLMNGKEADQFLQTVRELAPKA